ncbi:MAG: SPOR domain-containing protein [Candidatus Rokuibacteriota bacterium]
MNAGRALSQARWFRAGVVFSVVATVAVLVVPPVLRQATEREETRGLLVWMEHSEPGPLISRVAAASPSDLYWVQVGIFRDAEAAKRVAQRLRERKYRVQESLVQQRVSPGPAAGPEAVPIQGSGARYEVVVSGGASGEVAAKVAAKGLAGRSSTEGVVITPSLPLSEAVALSRDLADDGLAVRVRRVGAPIGPAPRGEHSQAGVASEAGALHRVRVGSFADRTAAMAALRDLEALGYKPFLARGNE